MIGCGDFSPLSSTIENHGIIQKKPFPKLYALEKVFSV